MPWLSQVKGVYPNVLVGQPYSRSVVGVQLPGLFSSELWRCSSDLLRGGARPPRKEVVALIDAHRERTTDGRRLPTTALPDWLASALATAYALLAPLAVPTEKTNAPCTGWESAEITLQATT